MRSLPAQFRTGGESASIRLEKPWVKQGVILELQVGVVNTIMAQAERNLLQSPARR